MGMVMSFSHLLTAGALTPSLAASCSWVSPRARRRAAIFAPICNWLMVYLALLLRKNKS